MSVTSLGKETLSEEDINYFKHFEELYDKEHIHAGSTSIVYRYKNFAIKEMLGLYNNESEMLRHEASILYRLSSVSNSFPKVYYVDDQIMVMDYIEGNPLSAYHVTPEVLQDISNDLSAIFVEAGIKPFDLHQDNVIVSGRDYYIVDVEKYVTIHDKEKEQDSESLAGHIYIQLRL
jgi:RIO-like serine/threonine protein kinase